MLQLLHTKLVLNLVVCAERRDERLDDDKSTRAGACREALIQALYMTAYRYVPQEPLCGRQAFQWSCWQQSR